MARARNKPAPRGIAYADRRYDIVALASSAGGLNALTQALRSIPADFPSSIVVVQHLAPRHKSMMPELLARSLHLHAKQAEHGEIILPGWVYVAPPDEHLLVGPVKLQLLHLQLVHFSRSFFYLLFELVS